MRHFKYGLIIFAVLMTVGCATTSENANVPVIDSRGTQPQTDDSEFDREQSSTIKDNSATKPASNSAALSLMKQATQQQQAGDYAGAARTLERAIRISPRNGELYYRLSEVRFKEQNYSQSEQLCRKAISLASGDSELQSRSRLLMKKAQQAQGGS